MISRRSILALFGLVPLAACKRPETREASNGMVHYTPAYHNADGDWYPVAAAEYSDDMLAWREAPMGKFVRYRVEMLCVTWGEELEA